MRDEVGGALISRIRSSAPSPQSAMNIELDFFGPTQTLRCSLIPHNIAIMPTRKTQTRKQYVPTKPSVSLARPEAQRRLQRLEP